LLQDAEAALPEDPLPEDPHAEAVPLEVQQLLRRLLGRADLLCSGCLR
jgi:hypothetical protein